MQKPHHLDIFGLLVYDHDQNNDPENIIVHSDICDPDTLPLSILFRDNDFLFEVEYKALPLCEGRILDVGSGTGCLSIILLEKGHFVESIDVSQGCVDFQNKNGLIAKCVDYFDLKDEKYDTILLMMNGIGVVGTLSRLPEFFKKTKELLNEGGKVLVDSSDIAYMFENEDGSIDVNLNQEYYGEVKYQMQYKENFGDFHHGRANTVDIDFYVLVNNLKKVKKLFEDNNHHYLAELKTI